MRVAAPAALYNLEINASALIVSRGFTRFLSHIYQNIQLLYHFVICSDYAFIVIFLIKMFRVIAPRKCLGILCLSLCQSIISICIPVVVYIKQYLLGWKENKGPYE